MQAPLSNFAPEVDTRKLARTASGEDENYVTLWLSMPLLNTIGAEWQYVVGNGVPALVRHSPLPRI